VLIDKLRLEEGQTTARHEYQSQSDFDREVKELADKGGPRRGNDDGRAA
jgi:hypothetical protein